ncbi:MAG: Calx-beta domain-containing protein [Balneolaceae bacterium]|nr:Calx-beta domain-containing protein [Balneolaceae bacterium]
MAGCGLFEQESREYDGPTVVEFFPLDDTRSEGSGQIQVEVQLIGPQRSAATNINWAVNDSATTATGDDYDIVSGNPVTIPANSSQTVITINLNGDGISAGTTRQLTLELTGGDVAPAENLKYYDLFIEGE